MSGATEFVAYTYGSGDWPQEGGTICSECGWLLVGIHAHPDAIAQHDASPCVRSSTSLGSDDA